MSTHIPDAALTQHMIALGKTGSGKSSALRVMVERMLNEDRRVCIVDPKGDWFGLKLSASGKSAGFPVVIFGGEHADVPINAHAGGHIAELVATGNRPCIIDLGGWGVGERTRFFMDFAAGLFRTNKSPLWLVIDECHNFAPQGKVLDPESGKMLHWANRLASEGRGKNVVLLAASQRPQKVHKDFVTSCETLVAMRVIHPLDRAAIKEWIDGCPDREKGREVLDSLATMKRGEAWVWSPEIGFGPVHMKFPLFKTYDSFSPQTESGAANLRGWAEVDLEDVKAKLESVVKEAKDNDPRELKKRIAELQKQLRERPAETKTIQVEKIVEVPVLKNGQLDRTEKIADRLQKFADQFVTETTELRRLIAPANAPRPAVSAVNARPATVATPSRPAAPKVATDAIGRDALTGPERKIIDAIAWLDSVGVSEPEQTAVAFLAGYTYGGGGFNNPRGALNTKGLVEYQPGNKIKLTNDGRSVAEFPEEVLTTESLHQKVLSVLPGPESKLMAHLFTTYPEPITNEGLADATGYTAGAGGYNNPRGRLRSLGLIEYVKGLVVARDILFLSEVG